MEQAQKDVANMQTVRHRDICTGHYCYPPRENETVSPDVFINSRGAHRVGDGWKRHVCGDYPGHGGTTQLRRVANVFVNSMPQALVADPISCGSSCMTGSLDVFVNG